MAKTHSSAELHPAKSLESSHPDMATTIRKSSDSPTEQPTSTAKFDLNAPPEARVDDPPKLPDGYEPKLSPLLKGFGRGVVFQAAAVELDRENKQLVRENQELAVKAEKHDKHRQQSRDSYFRQKEENHEEVKRKQRKYKRDQRTRDKQKAQQQEQENDTAR